VTGELEYQVTEELLARIRDVLVRECNPRLIVLFGSRARGGGRPDSDLDLLIVVDEPFGPHHSRARETGRLRLALFGVRVPMDLVLVDRHDFERHRDSDVDIVGEALRTGRVLHARAE
jgi:predicted nucleotidyltransferase